MHELGIVFHIIDSVEAVGKENALQSVRRVTMELGEVSGVVPEALIDCWNWAKKRSELLKNSTMEIEPLQAVTLCRACGAEYSTVAHGRICPQCGSGETHLLTGTQINIKEIAAC